MSQSELESVSEQLTVLTERLAERILQERRLGALRRDLGVASKRKKELAQMMSSEKRDVEKLEGLSLTNLFHTILSSKKEQLEKERQEFLAAKLKWDQCRDEWRVIKASIVELEELLGELDDVSGEHRRLAERKKELLIAMGEEAGREIQSLDEELADHRARRRELEEAISAGRRARSSLREVIKSLGSAGNWGVWDMMGGGVFSTAIKHSHIDKARNAASRAQSYLSQFGRELEDLDRSNSAAVEIGGFSVFADYFLDGLIFDWLIQSKINKSRESTERALRRIEKTMTELDEHQRKTLAGIEDLEARRMRALHES